MFTIPYQYYLKACHWLCALSVVFVSSFVQSAAMAAAPAAASKNTKIDLSDQEIDQGIHFNNKQCQIDRSLLDKVLKSIPRLLRIVPALTNGKPSGLKVYPTRPYTVEKLGLLSGDIVKVINGKNVTTIDHLDEAVTTLRTASYIEIILDRKGETFTLNCLVR